MLGYGLFIAVMLVRFRTELGPLGVVGSGKALGLFMVSAGLDTLFNELDQLIEDGIKFVGIAVWSTTWAPLARPWARAA